MAPKRPASHLPVLERRVQPEAVLRERVLQERKPLSVDDPSLNGRDRRILRCISEYLESVGSYKHGDKLCDTVQSLIGENTPAWTEEFVEEVLRYIIETSRPGPHNSSSHISLHTLDNYFVELLAVNLKISHNPISRSTRDRLKMKVDALGKEYELVIVGYDRAQISLGTMNALLAGIVTSGISWPKCWCLLLFQSISTYTGVRPDHLLRVRSVELIKSPGFDNMRLGGDGARLRDFHLWIEREEPASPPKVYGWFTPRGGKTRTSKGVSFPLAPVGLLGYSPAALVLMYGGYIGALGRDGLEGLLRQKPGKVCWESDFLDAPLFPSRKDPTQNLLSRAMTETIRRICCAQGIDGLVDSRCYRSLMAAHVYSQHGAEKAMLALTHASGRVTRRYIGKATPFDLQAAIFGDCGSPLQAMDVNRRSARPRISAPRRIEPARLVEIMSDLQLEEIKEEQETIKRRLIEASDDERPDLKVQYNRISAKWTNRFLQLARQEMAKDMDSYMSDLAKGKISPYRGTDDILTLERAEETVRDYPEYAKHDAASILLPEDEEKIAAVDVLFGPPDDLQGAYQLLGRDGILGKTEMDPNGVGAARQAGHSRRADHSSEEDTSADES